MTGSLRRMIELGSVFFGIAANALPALAHEAGPRSDDPRGRVVRIEQGRARDCPPGHARKGWCDDRNDRDNRRANQDWCWDRNHDARCDVRNDPRRDRGYDPRRDRVYDPRRDDRRDPRDRVYTDRNPVRDRVIDLILKSRELPRGR